MLLLLAMSQATQINGPVKADEVRKKIENEEEADFQGRVIDGNLNIRAWNLKPDRVQRITNGSYGISNKVKVVTSKIDFSRATINGTLDLTNVILQNSTDFSLVKFNGPAYFTGSMFASLELSSITQFVLMNPSLIKLLISDWLNSKGQPISRRPNLRIQPPSLMLTSWMQTLTTLNLKASPSSMAPGSTAPSPYRGQNTTI